jgi:hypothetical protein
MKKMLFVVAVVISVAGCAAQPIPPHIQSKVDQIPADQLPTHFFAERDLCNSKRDEKRVQCIEKTRREYLAQQMAREERNLETPQTETVK